MCEIATNQIKYCDKKQLEPGSDQKRQLSVKLNISNYKKHIFGFHTLVVDFLVLMKQQ